MKILERYYYKDIPSKKNEQGIIILSFKIKNFSFKWFTDCGDWFIFLISKNNYVRFSSSGFMKWKK